MSSVNNVSSCPYATAAATVALSFSDDTTQEGSSSEFISGGSSSNTTTTTTNVTMVEELKNSCPAFAESNGCPFAPIGMNPDSVKRMLAKVPQSHYQQTAKFYQIMEHLHKQIPKITLPPPPPSGRTTGGGGPDTKAAAPPKKRTPFSSFSVVLANGCPMEPYFKAQEENGGEKKEEEEDEERKKSEENADVVAARPPRQPRVVSFNEAMENLSLSIILARLAKDYGEQLEGERDDDDEEEQEEEQGEGGDPDDKTTQVAKTDDDDDDNNNKKNNNNSSNDESTQPSQPKPGKRESYLLAEALKSGTALSHQAAEDVHFVKNFIRGKIDRKLFANLVLSMYFVYDELERALEQHGGTHFPLCHFPKELARREALRDDVEFWHGKLPTSRKDPILSCSPATEDYIERIQYIARTDPILLLAHSYTRYLGDLSGGKILQRVARKALKLGKKKSESPDGDDDDGLAFYRFEHIESPKRFKDKYRQGLDSLRLSNQMTIKMVQEANIAFCLNMRIFQELDVTSNIPHAKVMSMEDVMTKFGTPHPQIRTTSSTSTSTSTIPGGHGGGEENKCPFLIQQKEKQEQQPQKRKSSTNSRTTTTATTAATTTTTKTTERITSRCPWPFIFFHDPIQGIYDWETWFCVMIVGLVVIYKYWNDDEWVLIN